MFGKQLEEPEGFYHISKTVVTKKKNPELYEYLDDIAHKANNLRNAAIFRIRQMIFAKGKDTSEMSEHELEVISEMQKTEKLYHQKRPSFIPSYVYMEKLMRATKNPDFFSGIPSQTAQMILNQTITDFNTWLKALKSYKENPALFTGRPKMPKYGKKNSVHTFKMSNQVCLLRNIGQKTVLTFPKTKQTMTVGYIPKNGNLKEVSIQRFYDDYAVCCTFEVPKDVKDIKRPYSCGIDLGVDNIAALVSNNRKCVLYKGGAVKAENQWYNKKMAELRAKSMKGYDSTAASKKGLMMTKAMLHVQKHRNRFMHDAMQKISSDIIRFCKWNYIGRIVIGHNTYWKQECNMGHVKNQNFVMIPYETLVAMITYKAEREGIVVVRQEESYTSKASLVNGDDIPTYKPGSSRKYHFSGRRIKRGLYKTKDGQIYNADLNGAGNILRKYDNQAFQGIKDWLFLEKEMRVVKYTDLSNGEKKAEKSAQKPGEVKKIKGQKPKYVRGMGKKKTVSEKVLRKRAARKRARLTKATKTIKVFQ